MKGEIKLARKLISKDPDLNMRDARRRARAMIGLIKFCFVMGEIKDKLNRRGINE